MLSYCESKLTAYFGEPFQEAKKKTKQNKMVSPFYMPSGTPEGDLKELNGKTA